MTYTSVPFLSRANRKFEASALLVMMTVLAAAPAFAAQTWRGKNVYFGDVHWHSCLSQDAGGTTPTAQYQSMIYDYGLDFSMTSEHAEASTAGVLACDTYLPLTLDGAFPHIYRGEEIATAMKTAAHAWNGFEHGAIRFVTFPGYEWAPDARCWQSTATNPFPNDFNADDNTPGHINYFFDDTVGWTYHDDVWEPGDGDSDVCAAATAAGITWYAGSKDWVDEILGQLIHQRDDPDRSYDLLIQYNHPAASIDKGGSSDHLAKWFDFEHSGSWCSVAEGGAPCSELHCEALRRAYGLTSVEWYTNHEAGIGSTERHGDTGAPCTGDPFLDLFSPRCFHDTYHVADLYVSSHALREGYQLGWTGGSDSHGGRSFEPDGFPGDRGAGSRSLTVAYAAEATRPAIWDAVSKRHTYALSRFREIGPVHKGRVDFYSTDASREYVMGDMAEATAAGTARDFTISAASEEGVTDVVPVELRLYRVSPNTPLTTKTDTAFYWLDDIEGDPGKLGELIGIVPNSTASSTLTHTFSGVVVYPGDAIFAVVPYSDYTWIDDHYDTNKEPLDDGETGYAHTDNNTWARTSPIVFHASDESPIVTPVCAHVTFNGSGATDPAAEGGTDASTDGDEGILPVAIPGVYDLEWNRWRFTLPIDYQYVDLSFFTEKDEDDTGHLFAVRIDGQLVYSGRAGIDHDADTLVELKDLVFPLAKGLHQLEVHMDDQEFAHGDNDPDYHCNDYDGPPGFVDMVAFHNEAGALCGDVTPPEITCPDGISLECNTAGGVDASDAAVVAFLGGASATDDIDTTPTITNDAPSFFPTGATTVTFTATDDAGNAATCLASVTVSDTIPPVLGAFSLTPATLRPPKHNLIPISVPTLTATDVCDAAPAIRCSVTSNEPPNGLGDGDKPIDIVFNGQNIPTQGTGERQIATTAGQGSFTLQLRAERGGKGIGRVYATSCLGVDAGGNRGTAKSAIVTVPK